MAFPLAAVAMGVNVLGGIKGLLDAGSSERRARQAQQMALADLTRGMEEEEANVRGSGLRGLGMLRGNLNDSLESGGRSLGDALAGAGVYNSSATAGALANTANEGNRLIGEHTMGLGDTLARLKSKTMGDVARYKLGFASNDMNMAREQQAGAAGGIASILGSLGQMNLGKSGANANNPNQTGVAMDGNSNSVLQMPELQNIMAPGLQTTGMGLPNNANLMGAQNLSNPFKLKRSLTLSGR